MMERMLDAVNAALANVLSKDEYTWTEACPSIGTSNCQEDETSC